MMADSMMDAAWGNPDWPDNWTLGSGGRIELMEKATFNVWLCQEPVTADQVAALSIPADFMPALSGAVVADAAFFSRSPDADVDGPLDVREIAGLQFVFVARPVGREPVGERSALMSIDKHHTTVYLAGRTIEILDFGDGTVAVPAWSNPEPNAAAPDPELAPDWTIRQVELARDLVAVIPTPAKVAFLSDGSGFHGPVPGSVIAHATASPSES